MVVRFVRNVSGPNRHTRTETALGNGAGYGSVVSSADKPAARPNGVNWRFRRLIAISMDIHERQLSALKPSEQSAWDNQIDPAVHVKTELMLLQPCQSTDAETAAVIIAGIPSFQESNIR